MTRRVISQLAWRKLLLVLVTIVGFVLLYQVTIFDSRDLSHQEAIEPPVPEAVEPSQFSATAYCKGTTTASGVRVRKGIKGIAASDPAILPLGSVVTITTDTAKYNGVYTILDTGPKVQGRILDLYMWSCYEALAFGRKQIKVTVLRLGWNPSADSRLIDRLFKRREAARNAALAASPVSDGVSNAKSASPGRASEAGTPLSVVPATPHTPNTPVTPVVPRVNVP